MSLALFKFTNSFCEVRPVQIAQFSYTNKLLRNFNLDNTKIVQSTAGNLLSNLVKLFSSLRAVSRNETG